MHALRFLSNFNMCASEGPVSEEHSADGRVTTIILARPAARNAVDGPTAAALAAAFLRFDEDESARVAVLFGSGGAFCAGADLKAVAQGIEQGLANPLREPSTKVLLDEAAPDAYNRSEGAGGPMGPSRFLLRKPVIAAIAGPAVAGGLELACWCDMRVVEEGSVMGVFCRRWGVPLIDGGTFRLPRLIGQSRAMDLVLTGRAVGAAEALSLGLANRVARPSGSVAEHEHGFVAGTARSVAEDLAAQLAKFPQQAMLADRASVHAAFAPSLPRAVAGEYARGLPSLREGVAGASRFAAGAGRGGALEQPARRFSTAAAKVLSAGHTSALSKQPLGRLAAPLAAAAALTTLRAVGRAGDARL